MSARPVIGIDLGGTSAKGVLCAPDGTVLASDSISADATAPLTDALHPAAAAVRALTDRLRAAAGGDIHGIGLAAPGLAAADGRSIACMPQRMEWLQGLEWSAILDSPSPVPVLNDAHAALLGEVWCGAARGLRHVALFTLGTGVGGAILTDGKLLRGALGRAGHFGHLSLDPDGSPGITGTPGSLEDAIGNHNISRRSGGRFSTTHDLLDACRTGDPHALSVWQKSVRALAAAIVSVVNIIDCEAVVIGGGIAGAGPALFTPLAGHLAVMEWRPHSQGVRILPATLGPLAGAIGAASQVLPLPENHSV